MSWPLGNERKNETTKQKAYLFPDTAKTGFRGLRRAAIDSGAAKACIGYEQAVAYCSEINVAMGKVAHGYIILQCVHLTHILYCHFLR